MAARRTISMSAISFFQENFQDYESADEAYKILKDHIKRKNDLENAMNLSEMETSRKLAEVQKSCEETLHKLEELNENLSKIYIEQEQYKSKSSVAEKRLSNLKSESDQLKQKQYILNWLQMNENISSQIELALTRKEVSHAVHLYNQLYRMCGNISQTSCAKIKTALNQNCENWFNKLKIILMHDFEDLLTTIKYPFATGITSPLFNKKDESEERLKSLVTLMMKLRSINQSSDHSLLSEGLINSLKKRFCFHFYGKRHTNNIAKPEWFFTQIINWMRDHEEFYDTYVQQCIDSEKNPDHRINIKSECNLLLIQLCQDKVASIMEEVIQSESLFAHLIDELLIFEEEIKNYMTGVDYNDRCLNILFQDVYLNKWLELEKNFATSTVSALTDDGDQAWECKYETLSDVKEKNILYFVPKCVEEFVSFLYVMLERHKSLEDVAIQKKFLQVLFHSLDLFIHQLKEIASLEVIHPITSTYCSLLNGSLYIILVLEEWNDDFYFLNLNKQLDVVDYHENEDDKPDKNEKVFDSIILLLKQFNIEMTTSITEYIEVSIQTTLNSYKNEKWHSLPPLKQYIMPALTQSGGELMLYLKKQLYTLQCKCCNEVFQDIWKSIAKMMDHLIFGKVVFETHFNEGGSSQFQFDMKNNLFLLFGEYTAKPETYFKFLKESCIILNLLPGSAILLKEVFQQADTTCKSLSDKGEFVKNSLKEIGVNSLNYTQVDRLLLSRIDWPKV